MRIPGNIYQNAQIHTRTDRATQGARADGADDSNNARATDQAKTNVTVAVSAEAKVLATDRALDTAKVDQLRAAIQNGTFSIGYESLAATLIETGG